MANTSERPQHDRADSFHIPPVPIKQSNSQPSTPSQSPPTRLRKPVPSGSHSRAASGQFLVPQPTLLELRQDVADATAIGVVAPLSPPPAFIATSHSRPSSLEYTSSSPGTPGSRSYSRPVTPVSQPLGPSKATSPSATSPSGTKEKKKHGWFGKSKKDKNEDKGPTAWIAGQPEKNPYDVDSLLAARPLHELCDYHNGDCLIYLWPRGSNKGASFKIDSAVFASSPILTQMVFGDNQQLRQPPLDARTQGLSLNNSPSQIRQEVNLYLPVKFSAESAPAVASKAPTNPNQAAKDDLQALVDARNFVAFLCGQSLVATEKKSSLFNIFMTIGGMLQHYGFSNYDGSTFGEVATSSFNCYVEELELADCRVSREKTIEGIVLGERMRSVLLYNEAFTHAAGRHDEIIATRSPKLALISQITRNRLIRATMDLDKRTGSIRLILNDFDFPMIKNSTIMNSRVSEERKEGVRFDQWWDAFTGMRKYFLGLNQSRYGNWPPKARSKKNDLETSGLNRLVCRDIYDDMTSMYDLLVNRKSLTTRTANGIDTAGTQPGATIRALRMVLNEYDGSSPPAKPPIPFDVPKLPSLKTTRPDFGTGDKKADLKAQSKKLKDDEIARILRASWNDDVVVTPFVDAFRDMEKRAAHGCTIGELVELRMGQWLFMYAVLQALPMLACDAPAVKHTRGVEYFLCEPPRGGVPWANANAASGTAATAGRRTWFSVGDGGGVVSLPSDVVEHGVEGIFRRSHCWVMAEQWSASNPVLHEALHVQEARTAAQMSSSYGSEEFNSSGSLPLPQTPNPGFLQSHSREHSPSRAERRASYMGGLEALAVPPEGLSPAGLGPAGRPRTPVHVVDTTKTFDSILSDVAGQKKGKKK